ncbi:MAG: hypothetical protein LBU14_02790, partial [Candidatus Peribacteria bacterium]|nr:hypothetical protein [Candidatus Peribacteria bacterium]
MEKRKITKFRPLCPSDISPYKGATKQKIPPLYKELISSFPRLLETKQKIPPLYKELISSFPKLLETKQEVPPL